MTHSVRLGYAHISLSGYYGHVLYKVALESGGWPDHEVLIALCDGMPPEKSVRGDGVTYDSPISTIVKVSNK